MSARPLGDLSKFKLCVVGSGFFGAVVAERAANELNIPVLVIEKRNHIGGNSWSYRDSDSGIDVHQYGSHIFHTSNQAVWEYLNRFTTFNKYIHRVQTIYQGQSYSIPINLKTINKFFKLNLDEQAAHAFMTQQIQNSGIKNPANFEEKAISLIGQQLYEAFIKGYSQKQWETDLSKLPASIITRLPVRFNDNDRYFDDNYEGIPCDGYDAIFKSMLSNKNISIFTEIDYFQIRDCIPAGCLIVYTGPIDQFFAYKHGHLGWRTLSFEKEKLETADFQGTSIVNYAEVSVPYTRIHEFRHFTPERNLSKNKTIIYREFSKSAMPGQEPYYPINTENDKKLLEIYKQEAKQLANVIFGGRLASYKYLDMHQVIGSALHVFEKDIKVRLSRI